MQSDIIEISDRCVALFVDFVIKYHVLDIILLQQRNVGGNVAFNHHHPMVLMIL